MYRLGYMYAAEILPFRIRAMGFGVLIFANKAALCFNQFVNPIGLAALGWKYYPVYIAVRNTTHTRFMDILTLL